MAEPQHLLFGFLFAVSLFVLMQSGSANQKTQGQHNTPPSIPEATIHNPAHGRDLDSEEEYPSREFKTPEEILTHPSFGVGQNMIVKKAINAQFPEVKVVGGNYPPSSTNQMLSHLVFGLQIAGFAFMFFGEFLCRQLGIAVPPIYYQLQEKKMFVLFGLFFVGNSLSNSLLSTGAFEVTVHEDSPELPGRLLWSKLATGNVPTTDYVLQRLQSEFGLRPIAHEPIYS